MEPPAWLLTVFNVAWITGFLILVAGLLAGWGLALYWVWRGLAACWKSRRGRYQ